MQDASPLQPVSTVRSRAGSRQSPLLRAAGRALAAVVVLGAVVVWPRSAGAADVTAIATQSVGTITSVDVTPHPATSNTATVTVTLTGARLASGALTSGAFAASLCGNHTTAGVALTPADLGNTLNCDGALQVAFIVFNIHADGATTFSYTLRSSGIGNNATQCLPGGLVPCTIGIGDVATSGASFALGIPVFGGPGTGPTTTTTTTVPGSTTTTGSASTTTRASGPGVTTTTTLPATTTTVATTTTTTLAATTTTIAATTTTLPTTTTSGPKPVPAVTVTPSTGLTKGQKVRVVVTGLAAFEGQAVAVTQCGNADSTGKAIIGEPTPGDCFGAEGLASGQLVLAPVARGTVTIDYLIAVSAIGVKAATCSAAVSEPCIIGVADVTTQGKALTLRGAIRLAPTVAAGVAPAAPAPGDTTPTGNAGALALTGLDGTTIVFIAVSVGLLELGWMLTSGTRPARRGRP